MRPSRASVAVTVMSDMGGIRWRRQRHRLVIPLRFVEHFLHGPGKHVRRVVAAAEGRVFDLTFIILAVRVGP
jgi:hypothetical protein